MKLELITNRQVAIKHKNRNKNNSQLLMNKSWYLLTLYPKNLTTNKTKLKNLLKLKICKSIKHETFNFPKFNLPYL